MEYISTRGEKCLSSSSAMLKGIAGDGGLYVPLEFPKVSLDELQQMFEMDYAERAELIISKFLTDFDYIELKEMCANAYARFDEVAPLVKVDYGTYILELWHGPTLAFKDVALVLLPHLLNYAKKKDGTSRKTLILVATSGDTGKAALESFSDVENTAIIVFYPNQGVSEMQKIQMQTSSGANVHVVGIDGNFDDAQTAVKQIFKDPEIAKMLQEADFEFSSANSINWGRLVPQIVYYFSAYVDLLNSNEITSGEEINVAVPTGNFGNILAAYYAKRMGLPIAKLLVCSNTNDVLTDFFKTGKYDANREFFKTISPSMDILISSNLERLLFEAVDRDSIKINDIISELELYGQYSIDDIALNLVLNLFEAYSSNDNETRETIDNFFATYGYLLDPHSAVAACGYYKYVADSGDETKTVILSTANPYKFSQDVLVSLNYRYEIDPFKAVKKLENYTAEPVPECISNLQELPILHTLTIAKDDVKSAVMDIIRKNFNKKDSNG
jgi:threonine synthase